MTHTFTVIIEINGEKKQYTVNDTVDSLLTRLTNYMIKLKESKSN